MTASTIDHLTTEARWGSLGAMGALSLAMGASLWAIAAQQFTASSPSDEVEPSMAAVELAPPTATPARPDVPEPRVLVPTRESEHQPTLAMSAERSHPVHHAASCISPFTFRFGPAKSDIEDERPDEVQQLIRALEQTPTAKVVVEGHASAPGSPAANLRVSRRRAGAVRRLLMQAGVDPERIVLQAYGAYRPSGEAEVEADRRAVVRLDGPTSCSEENAS